MPPGMRPATPSAHATPPSPGRRSALRRLGALGLRGLAPLALPPLTAVLAGCMRRGSEPGEWYSNWDLAGGCATDRSPVRWRDALGETSHFCPADEPGGAASPDGWTWVFYGAPWCGTSQRQAARMREFIDRVAGRARVYTVITAGGEPFTVPGVSDALAWAGRTGLPLRRVLFDPAEPDNRQIPQHLLVGPDARTWWRFVGGLPVEMMLEVLEDFASGRRQPRVRRIER